LPSLGGAPVQGLRGRDARDTNNGPVEQLPPGSRVGTSSLRRAAQLRAMRPDLELLALRGNVDTRIRKLREGQYDAVILAMAGLERLGLAAELAAAGQLHPLPVEVFTPAAGQGALAIQCLASDSATRELLRRIDDPDSSAALLAERSIVEALGADCHSAVGVHVRREGPIWRGWAMVVGDAGQIIRVTAEAPDAAAAARELLDRLPR
jgi:hydroxymethylbilane synthase